LLALSCVTLLLCAAARAEGCTCAMPGPPCQAFGAATAVFVGTVTDVGSRPRKAPAEGEETDWAPRVVTFTVTEAFSGVEGTAVQVSTGLGGADCGYGFVKGVSYVVYAHGYKGKRLSTGICTRTRPASGAADDLEYLRSLAGRPDAVTISGKVERQARGQGDGGGRGNVPLRGVRVTVAGPAGLMEAVTDAEGRYKVTAPGPGSFQVSVSLPEELTAYEPKRTVKVAGRGCATQNFLVSDNGRIGGRVLDAYGRPVPRLTVTLVDAEGRNPEFAYGRHETADEEGRFKFEGLPPGRYLVGVRLVGILPPDDPANAYPRTFYPGVARAEEAEVFELKAGRELKAHDLRLPPRLAESLIKVKVVWSDGTPVANAQVLYREVTHGDPKVNNSARADGRGEFTLKGHAGAAYQIEAASGRPQQSTGGRLGPPERAAPVTVNAAGAAETVTLVIRKQR
jgi:hypothetical protein